MEDFLRFSALSGKKKKRYSIQDVNVALSSQSTHFSMVGYKTNYASSLMKN